MFLRLVLCVPFLYQTSLTPETLNSSDDINVCSIKTAIAIFCNSRNFRSSFSHKFGQYSPSVGTNLTKIAIFAILVIFVKFVVLVEPFNKISDGKYNMNITCSLNLSPMTRARQELQI